MIEIGKYNTLKIARDTQVGLYLTDGNDDILLPNKYVPRELIERPKTGFGIPIGQWIRGPLREWAEDLLDETRIQQEGYLDSKLVRLLWSQHISCKYDWTARLWAILMFQSWLDSQK